MPRSFARGGRGALAASLSRTDGRAAAARGYDRVGLLSIALSRRHSAAHLSERTFFIQVKTLVRLLTRAVLVNYPLETTAALGSSCIKRWTGVVRVGVSRAGGAESRVPAAD